MINIVRTDYRNTKTHLGPKRPSGIAYRSTVLCTLHHKEFKVKVYHPFIV